MPLLYSIHDRDAHPLIPAGGWCVDAVLVTDEPPNYAAIRSDINWIVRLNHGWNPQGTIPVRSGYADYAKRCADFAKRTKGVNVFIISNEPNHQQEYPHGVPIAPEDYADCFNLCYTAIKQVRAEAQVCVAAVAPWDVTSGMDWLAYYGRMLAAIDGCGGLAVHGYCHGADPNLIWSAEKVQGWFWHFPVIYQTLRAIPSKFSRLPVHVTETNQGDNAWADRNSGYVQNAYQSINDHNQQPGTQKIHSLSLYRWRGDKWQIHDKPQVQDDFRAAVARGYTVESGPGPTPPDKPEPLPPTTPQPDPPPFLPERDIDPALFVRGVEFDFVTPEVGTDYWRMSEAYWFENAADDIGPDHHILGDVSVDGAQVAGVPLKVTWPSGDTTVISKADDPNAIYNFDYPMSPSLNEYSIWVNDPSDVGTGFKPSDKVMGIGMGKDGNPREHTSTWIAFSLVTAKEVTPPTPEPPDPQPPTPAPGGDKLLWPVDGPVSQRWGENPEFYQRTFSIPYHNGIDVAVPVGTKVIAAAEGIVKWVGNDPEGYGVYCRVYFAAFRLHILVAHLDSVTVDVGERVKRGQVIAASGNSGMSTGPHVHAETRLGTENAYFMGTFGHSNGRVDPQVVYACFGSAQGACGRAGTMISFPTGDGWVVIFALLVGVNLLGWLVVCFWLLALGNFDVSQRDGDG